MNTTTTDERWKLHPNLLPEHQGIPSGSRVRLLYERGSLQAGETATIYAIDSPSYGPTWRMAETDTDDGLSIYDEIGRQNGWSGLLNDVEVISTPDGTTPPPTFTWVNEDLKNLVHQHPRAEITRGLIRKLYDAVVPAELTTGEEIEAWALEKGLSNPVARPVTAQQLRQAATPERTITITATITGTERGGATVTRDFTSTVDVEVPFSVFEDGSRAVRDYVRDEAHERMWDNVDYGEDEVDWSDLEYNDSDYDSPKFDIDDALEEYEEATAEEEEEEEDED
jgi:hypothetical protein